MEHKVQIRLNLVDARVGFPLVYAVSEITRGVDFEIFQAETDVSAGVSRAVDLVCLLRVSIPPRLREGVAAERSVSAKLGRDQRYSLGNSTPAT